MTIRHNTTKEVRSNEQSNQWLNPPFADGADGGKCFLYESIKNVSAHPLRAPAATQRSGQSGKEAAQQNERAFASGRSEGYAACDASHGGKCFLCESIKNVSAHPLRAPAGIKLREKPGKAVSSGSSGTRKRAQFSAKPETETSELCDTAHGGKCFFDRRLTHTVSPVIII